MCLKHFCKGKKMLFCFTKEKSTIEIFYVYNFPCGRIYVHYTVYLQYFLDICVGKCVHKMIRYGFCGMMSGDNSMCLTLYLATDSLTVSVRYLIYRFCKLLLLLLELLLCILIYSVVITCKTFYNIFDFVIFVESFHFLYVYYIIWQFSSPKCTVKCTF